MSFRGQAEERSVCHKRQRAGLCDQFQIRFLIPIDQLRCRAPLAIGVGHFDGLIPKHLGVLDGHRVVRNETRVFGNSP